MAKKETWVNTAAGMRWFKAYAPNGEIVDKLVRGGQVFTLTAEERRYNQHLAVDELDLFRNGDFILKETSDETVEEEIASDVAFSDEKIEELLDQIEGGDLKMSQVIEDIDNFNTLQRFVSGAEERDMHHAKFKVAKDKIKGMKDEREAALVASKNAYENVTTPKDAGTETPISASRKG